MGQNLIRMPYYDFENGNTTTGSADGITFTLNADGSITANGTNGQYTAYCILAYYGTLTGGNVGDKVILKGCPKGGSTDTYYISLACDNSATDTGEGDEFTITQEMLTGTCMEIEIIVMPNVTMDNMVFKPYVGALSIADKLTTIAANEQKVYEAGQKSEYDRFWDAFQQNGSRDDYQYAFYGAWTNEIFRPKYGFVLRGIGVDRMFFNSKIADIKGALEQAGVVFDTSKCTRFENTFYQASTNSVPIMDASNCSSMMLAFYSAQNLKSIEIKNVKDTCTFDRSFNSNYKLEHISITGTVGKSISFKDSNLLTNASVQNIIDCLKDLTGQTTQALTVHATVGANMTEAQKAEITAKNWQLVY